MIGKRIEYERMHAVERHLWWYRILHGKVVRAIQAYAPSPTPRILDAGCGTGGLLDALRAAGFTDLTGFDFSADAVEFTQQRGFAVEELPVQEVARFQPGTLFDVIICNDVFCYLSEAEIVRTLRQFGERLRPGGLVITNNNAFRALRGTHDVAVGIPRRFVRADWQRFGREAGLPVRLATYWSMLLVPLIFAVRSWQRLSLRLNRVDREQVPSDVKLPPLPVNGALYRLVRLEERVLPTAPLGSSVFFVFQK
jgi:SAM-dependent methyltransferase